MTDGKNVKNDVTFLFINVTPNYGCSFGYSSGYSFWLFFFVILPVNSFLMSPLILVLYVSFLVCGPRSPLPGVRRCKS